MTIAQEIDSRKITEILHFTTHKGIVGTLHTQELLSRYQLPLTGHLEHILHVNAATRPEESNFFDKSENWLDYVNLSISEINRRYFEVSQRWHNGSLVWWGILAFDPSVMTHERVVFTTTNNAYDECCIRKEGLAGFQNLFEPSITRKPGWSAYRGNRAPNLTTCEQAEVLYPGRLPTTFLRRIYVQTGECQDQTRGWLREFGVTGVDVVISPEKFIGRKN